MAKKKADGEDTPVAKKSRAHAFMDSETIKAINKAYKADAVMLAAEARIQNTPRHSTGIFQLDYATGGGLVSGAIHTFMGAQSSGKTTAVLKTTGIAQNQCSNCWTGSLKDEKCECGDFREAVCAWINAEGTRDDAWWSANGVDLDRLVFNTPDYGEKAFDIVDLLLRGKDDEGGVDFLVIDSLAYLVPKVEVEKSLEEGIMGTQAFMLARGMKKIISALAMLEEKYNRRPTVIFTNQTRMRLGLVFGNPETVAGGNSPRFAATTEIKCSQGKTTVDETTGKPLYVDLRFKIEKNKSAPLAKYDGEYRLVLSPIENKKLGDVWDEPEMVRLAKVNGLLTGGGSSYHLFGEQYKGMVELEQKLMYDMGFKREMWKKLMSELLK